VFVVFLGVGAITLVAAGIASTWIASEERNIEREILADLHQQLGALRAELTALRHAVVAADAPARGAHPSATPARPPADTP
jgi:voltage-gated potassium channel